MQLRLPHPAAPRSVGDGIGGMDVGRAGVLARAVLPSAVVSAAKSGVRLAGQVSAARRVLPDYLVVGTKKGGTTSLANWLVQHPGVLKMFPPGQRSKSAHYFDSNFGRGVPWYRSHFPTARTREAAAADLGYRPVVGEASPFYVFHPAVPDRVRSLLPDVRVIVLLREPVARAYSHYWDRVSTGFETLATFEEAVAAEEQRLADVDETRFADPSYQHFSFEHHSYLARGRYAEQLARWFRVFAREQVLALEFERLATEPRAVLEQVWAFLGVPPHDGVDLRPRNERASSPPMAQATRERLRDYFRPYDRQLVELLGRELSWTAG